MNQTIKTAKLSILLLITLIMGACHQNHTKNLKTFSIEIYDSIIVKPELSELSELSNDFCILDYNPTKKIFLGYNFTNNEKVYIFDKSGEILYSTNFSGFDDVKFFDDTSIVFFCGNYANFYHYQNNTLLRKLKTDTMDYHGTRRNYTIFHKNPKKPFVFYHGYNHILSIADKNLYLDSNKFYNIFSFDDSTHKRFIEFEAGSIYKNPKYYCSSIASQYAIDKANAILYLIWEYEPMIYQYDLNNYSLIKKYPLEPDYFGEIKQFEFDDTATNGRMYFETQQTNSFYFKIFFVADTLFLQYIKGCDKKDATTSFDEINQVMAKQKRYMQIYHKSAKVCYDILLPKRISAVAQVLSSNEIIFYSYPSTEDKKNKQVTFLIGRIKEK